MRDEEHGRAQDREGVGCRPSPQARRLIVVSNRLPVVLTRAADGHWDLRPSAGGLVSALAPVLERRGGVWLGWPGVVGDHPAARTRLAAEDHPYTLVTIGLGTEEVEGFYHGVSNGALGPMFHGHSSYRRFAPSDWCAYACVNRRFARAIRRTARAGDVVWVHDYHLMCVGRDLRRLGYSGRVGFFLHIPFPPPGPFFRLPWARELLEALFAYDLIGL